MSRFTLPRDIYYGKGSIDELKNLKGQKGYRRGWRRLYEAFRLFRQGCQQSARGRH